MRVLRGCFPQLNGWLNQLPDPRCQPMCRYSGAHLWWQILGTLLSRGGSRHAFDQQRNTGAAPVNFGELCGQSATDPRFDGAATVTCSDNAARQAARVDPQQVGEIPLRLLRRLWERRLFDGARLFDHWYVLLVDGTVQEKCRQGFRQGGKGAADGARYRYVLQVQLLGPAGTVFPFLHESLDVHDPLTEKEDCELKAFGRVCQRVRALFPKRPICWVGDALYGCQSVIAGCQQAGWKYVFTLKEQRQPTLWDELLRLLPLAQSNALSLRLGHNGQDGRVDYRWVEELLLADGRANAILAGEITTKAATLYAFLTNFANLTPERVVAITGCGRARHRIEDTFNAEKNHGIGLEHVFCADATAAKNYYSMMQVAEILWVVTCHGCLRRLYEWARRATEQGLARAIWEGLRGCRLPPDLPPIGQVRFGFG